MTLNRFFRRHHKQQLQRSRVKLPFNISGAIQYGLPTTVYLLRETTFNSLFVQLTSDKTYFESVPELRLGQAPEC